MQLRALKPSCVAQALFVAMLAFSSTPGAQSPPPVPLVRENVTEKISDHVYVIPDASVPLVPNIGFVVGSKATLVIDTGMGRRNGDAVMRELAKVSKNSQWYVATTHFHPEHSMGTSFPAGTTFVYPKAQQPEGESANLVLKIHVGRHLLGFTGKPDRSKWLARPSPARRSTTRALADADHGLVFPCPAR